VIVDPRDGGAHARGTSRYVTLTGRRTSRYVALTGRR
jgi:hypothetical protein